MKGGINMKINKTIFTVLAVSVIGFGLLNSGTVLAAEPTGSPQDTFCRNMQAKMQANIGERLTKLVSEGKITEAQKAAIIAKHAEMSKNVDRDALRNMSREERQAAMEKKRTEFTTWAASQGIDVQDIMPLGNGGQGGHRGSGMMRGER